MKKIKILTAITMIIAFSFCISCTGSGNDKDYKPTVDKAGEYKTEDGKDNQVQYQGSQEQKSDLEAIDDYAKDHPGF